MDFLTFIVGFVLGGLLASIAWYSYTLGLLRRFKTFVDEVENRVNDVIQIIDNYEGEKR